MVDNTFAQWSWWCAKHSPELKKFKLSLKQPPQTWDHLRSWQWQRHKIRNGPLSRLEKNHCIMWCCWGLCVGQWPGYGTGSSCCPRTMLLADDMWMCHSPSSCSCLPQRNKMMWVTSAATWYLSDNQVSAVESHVWIHGRNETMSVGDYSQSKHQRSWLSMVCAAAWSHAVIRYPNCIAGLYLVS